MCLCYRKLEICQWKSASFALGLFSPSTFLVLSAYSITNNQSHELLGEEGERGQQWKEAARGVERGWSASLAPRPLSTTHVTSLSQSDSQERSGKRQREAKSASFHCSCDLFPLLSRPLSVPSLGLFSLPHLASNSICLIWHQTVSVSFGLKQCLPLLASFDVKHYPPHLASNSICLIWPHLTSNSICLIWHQTILASFDVKQYVPHLASRETVCSQMRQIQFDVKLGQKRQILFEAKWGRYCLTSNEANTVWCKMRPNEANTDWCKMRPNEAHTVWGQMRQCKEAVLG